MEHFNSLNRQNNTIFTPRFTPVLPKTKRGEFQAKRGENGYILSHTINTKHFNKYSKHFNSALDMLFSVFWVIKARAG